MLESIQAGGASDTLIWMNTRLMAEADPYVEELADQWKVIHDLKPTALRVTTSTSLLNKDVSVCIAIFFLGEHPAARAREMDEI